jgi:hydrogenase nickel incorporation protein HypA/HybF
MHEMSLVQSVLGKVLAVAAQHAPARVTRVNLQVGELRQVNGELLRFAFEAATAGTCAEGAELSWVPIPVRMHCASCEKAWVPESWSWACPDCGLTSSRVLQGDELVLESLELEEERQASDEDTDRRKSA